MDLTKLTGGKAPEQAAPQMSKEEYAAVKKAEREAAWDTVNNQAETVLANGENLKGFLDFVAKNSLQRTDTLLLLYSQNPDITWAKTFDDWKKDGRHIREGAAGYTAIVGDTYEKEGGEKASGYRITKMFDVKQTTGRQPAPEPVYTAEDLVTALFIAHGNSIQVSDKLPEKVSAQYVPGSRTVFVRNKMEAGMTFRSLAREFAAASLDLHDGRFRRADVAAQTYCAAYVLCRKYGQSVEGFDLGRVCERCSALAPEGKRRFLGDVKAGAYAADRPLRQGLRDMEMDAPSQDLSMELAAEAPKEKPAEKKGRAGKAAQPQEATR